MRTRRLGFTLIEVVVVCSIVVVAASILLPALQKARKQAQRVQVSNSLKAITVAIQVYEKETRGHIGVPGPISPGLNGGYAGGVEIATWLMRLPVKGGTQGPAGGTTVTLAGKPYLNASDFPTRPLGDGGIVMLDRFEQPILYFPASPAKPNVRFFSADTPPYIGGSDTTCRYDRRDNPGPTNAATGNATFSRSGQTRNLKPEQRFAMMLGDTSPTNGTIDPGETEVDKPFLLWSAGPDGMFGPDEADDLSSCDDVTNFRE